LESPNIESVKEYWNSRPCNIRHSSKEIGTLEYFDEVDKRRYFVEPHILDFANFPEWTGKSVLEIGCGIGTDSIRFCNNGAKLTAVDLSTESLAVTQKRLKVYNQEAELLYANAEKLSDYLEPRPYDLIYSFGVLHHTPNPLSAFSEVKKYMNESSIFKLMVYHKGAFKVFQILEDYNFDYAEADKLIAKHSEAQTGCPVTFSYTSSDIISILDSLGFEVIKCEVDHIFPYKIEKYKKYEYEIEEIWNMPDETFSAFKWKYGWHLLITAKLKK
jgi:SAM-dependent methyltransferase